MDMREMVDKVKRGEPIYGTSQLTEYMQGVASRQSRYAATWIHVMPWFNLVNHNQVRPFPYISSVSRYISRDIPSSISTTPVHLIIQTTPLPLSQHSQPSAQK